MKPVAKISAAALGGAVSTLLLWVLALYGVDAPAEVGAALATLVAVAAGYLTPGEAPAG